MCHPTYSSALSYLNLSGLVTNYQLKNYGAKPLLSTMLSICVETWDFDVK